MEVDFNAAQIKYKKLMDERDKISPSPTERAQYVWDYLQLQNPRASLWDIVCFCVEYLGAASEDIEVIQPAIKQLISQVYTAHYNVAEPLGTGVPRETEHSNVEDGRSGEPTPIRPRLTLENGGKERQRELDVDNGNDSKGDRKPSQ